VFASEKPARCEDTISAPGGAGSGRITVESLVSEIIGSRSNTVCETTEDKRLKYPTIFNSADVAVAGLRKHHYGRDACVIGEVKAEAREIVVLKSVFSGARIVDMLVGEQAPRIC